MRFAITSNHEVSTNSGPKADNAGEYDEQYLLIHFPSWSCGTILSKDMK